MAFFLETYKIGKWIKTVISMKAYMYSPSSIFFGFCKMTFNSFFCAKPIAKKFDVRRLKDLFSVHALAFMVFTLFFIVPCHGLNDAAAVSKKEVSVASLDTPVGSQYSGEKFYNIKSFTLENGLEVFLLENHRTPAVGITVVYRVGSADDPHGKSGLAHFVEHMMFKGEKGSIYERLMPEAEAVGGQVNATTHYDRTLYYEIVPKSHIETFIKYEAERMKFLPVRQEDVTSEMQVVLEEENMSVGNQPNMQFLSAVKSAFFIHHPYGVLPIGYRPEIESYTPEDVKQFHERHYGPNNAFVILSGDLTIEEAQSLMKKHFGDIPQRGGWERFDRDRVQHIPLTYSTTIEKKTDRVANPHILYDLPGLKLNPENLQEADALELGIYVLTNSQTGSLYRKLVEDLKLASFFYISFDMNRVDADAILMHAQSTNGVAKEELEAKIRQELTAALKQGITEKQLAAAKMELLLQGDYIKDSLLGGADNLIEPFIAGYPLDRLEHWQSVLKSLTVDEVNKALRKYLTIDHHVKGYLIPENPGQSVNAIPQDPSQMMSITTTR